MQSVTQEQNALAMLFPRYCRADLGHDADKPSMLLALFLHDSSQQIACA